MIPEGGFAWAARRRCTPGMRNTEITLRLPDWIRDEQWPEVCQSHQEKTAVAIRLAHLNVTHRTGGPFGAAVFETGSGRLVSLGVNLVVPARCSLAHAEMVALSLAQQSFGSHDLSAAGCDLATSTEPCAMCLGAIPWSGVSRVICAAREEDARRVGFDEGAKPSDWVAELNRRGIEVVRDVLRDQARAVLDEYRRSGQPVYNPKRSSA